MNSAFESRVFDLINLERVENNLDPLRINEQLVMAAQYHSQSMANDDFFSHQGIDGSTPFERIRAQGYSYQAAGENIAAGFATPESVVQAWMGSSGHRANILSEHFTEIGIGHHYNPNDLGLVNYSHYWTVNLGTTF
ncbi:MAG: CAP domain-containing protein [Crocosphaera sp.]|nr:CAP domain-containing protein [Crocosphaera sp.]